MCGIVGVFYKREGATGPVGQIMADMCDQLFRRGPDSAGVALYGPRCPPASWFAWTSTGPISMWPRARSSRRPTR